MTLNKNISLTVFLYSNCNVVATGHLSLTITKAKYG